MWQDQWKKCRIILICVEHTSDLGSFSIAGLQGYQINYSLHQTLLWRFLFKKIIFSGHFRHNLTISTLVSSGNAAVLHFPYLSTNMVVASCMLNIQTCMIYHINQNFSADAKMYHTWLYVKCTIIYDHKCTQFWRSVSALGHGNLILNKLTPAVRVRSPGPHSESMFQIKHPVSITKP